MSELYV